MRGALGTTRPERHVIAGRLLLPSCPIALIAVVIALASLASACGGSGPKDPFVGTWDGGVFVVIGKAATGYSVTQFNMTWEHAERSGNVLHCWDGAKPQPGREEYLTYKPSSGQLLLTQPAPGPGVHVPLHKVSDGTVAPSPFPGFASSPPAP